VDKRRSNFDEPAAGCYVDTCGDVQYIGADICNAAGGGVGVVVVVVVVMIMIMIM
jgi:hypothetical protein